MSIPLARIMPAQVFRAALKAANEASRSFSTTAACARRQPRMPEVTLPKPSQDLFVRTKPISAYLGANPFRETLRQGKIENCYLLSSVDAMQYHPQGKTMLESIRVEELPQSGAPVHYKLYFPSGKQAEMSESELGMPQGGYLPVQGAKGFQMLELGFGKVVSRIRNKNPEFAPIPYPNDGRDHALALVGCGLPSDALGKMLVGHQWARITRGNEDPRKLALMVDRIAKDKKHNYVICAITQAEGEGNRLFKLPPRADGQERKIKEFLPFHSYSIRNLKPDGTVTVADPLDTKNKVEQLTLDEFSHIFTCVDGIRFKKGK